MQSEEIELKFHDALARYAVDKVSIWRNRGYLTVQIESRDPPLQGDDHGCSAPMVQASWKSDILKHEDLMGVSIQIPRSYDEEIGDHVTSFYFSSHNDLNDCRVRFYRGDDGDIWVEVIGFAPEDGVHWGQDSGVHVTVRAKARFESSEIIDQTPEE